MSRVHDMGGRFGDGPVRPDSPADPLFEKEWHARALAVSLAAGALGAWNLDMLRHAREGVAASDYARFSYYEKWMAGLADVLVQTGTVARSDLTDPSGNGAPSAPLAPNALRAEAVPALLAKGGPAARDSAVAPRFAPGDHVRTLRPAANRVAGAGGHTRLPVYAAGAEGEILRYHGTHVFPDSNAHGLGEAPEPLYAVAFNASVLWAQPEHGADEVILDLWQSYLEPV
ncbi:MAG: nitrile hydratase subunit beta [Pseudomonadota bacterium]